MSIGIGQRILGTMERIARFGHRWMGSDGEANARGFIVQALEVAGLAVDCEPFDYLAFIDYGAAFTAAGRPMACEPLAYSAITDTAVTAPLLYVGEGTSGDYARLAAEGREICGSIVLSDNLRSFVAYPEAEAAGARAFVLVTTMPGDTIRCGAVRFDRKPGTIPALSIGGDDGRAIIAALKEGENITATLSISGRLIQRTGQNVVGTPWKAAADAPRILLSAHYDSFWNGIHAMDNLAGVATLIELARTLPAELGNNLEFVFFAGEELGSWGAAGYVRRPDFDPCRVRALINLDAFGSESSDLELGVTENLSGLCRKAAARLGIAVDRWNTPPREASDHKEFLPFGIPVVWLANNGNDKAYHTPLDRVERMSQDKLSNAFALSTAIARLVRWSDEPIRR